MDDKTKAAMEAEAEAERILGGYWYQEEGALALAEWMHAHDAEKVTLAEAYIRVHPHAREGKYTEIAQRIIAEAKEDTDGT